MLAIVELIYQMAYAYLAVQIVQRALDQLAVLFATAELIYQMVYA